MFISKTVENIHAVRVVLSENVLKQKKNNNENNELLLISFISDNQ
jgi:hypothetical protein